MTTRKKTKAPAVTVRVPQSQGDAIAAIARIGELNRMLARREADLNDTIADLKESAEIDAAPIKAQVVALIQGVEVWAAANRDALTDGGKVKTADLGTGKISWRLRPPSVSVRKLEEVIANLKRLGLQRFVRIKEEVNKEAMLAEPDVARTVAGVTIGSAGEDFIVEPFETELAPAQAVA
jgi:phage host-nuclease inhibitor protein Gam